MMPRLRFSTPKSEIFLGGFTLIELVTVIVLISILVSLGVPVYNRAIERARDNEARTNLLLMAIAERVYFQENRYFFPDAGGGWLPSVVGEDNIDEINTNLRLNLNEVYWDYLILHDEGPIPFLELHAVRKQPNSGFLRQWVVELNLSSGIMIDEPECLPYIGGTCP